jgi:hypothetical protein
LQQNEEVRHSIQEDKNENEDIKKQTWEAERRDKQINKYICKQTKTEFVYLGLLTCDVMKEDIRMI